MNLAARALRETRATKVRPRKGKGSFRRKPKHRKRGA